MMIFSPTAGGHQGKHAKNWVVRRSANLMTGLALALLAVMGFIAPSSAPRRAGTVQVAEQKKSAVEQSVELTDEAPARASDTALPAEKAEHPHLPRDSRRYLFNHAWLI